jgi:hypothetical protein
MPNVARMIAEVERTIKSLDPGVIVQGTLYDEPSGRLVVTVVKGARRASMVLPGRCFEDGHKDRIAHTIKERIKQLEQMPPG